MQYARHGGPLPLVQGRWIGGDVARIAPDLMIPADLADSAVCIHDGNRFVGVVARSIDFGRSCIIHEDFAASHDGLTITSPGDLSVAIGISPATRSPLGHAYDRPESDLLRVAQHDHVIVQLA